MRNTPYLVLNRSNRRVLHQAATLAEAEGFSRGCPKPTATAMLIQCFPAGEIEFCIQLVTDDGQILATSRPMQIDRAIESFMDSKVLLVPRCLAGEEVST
jgi:hypothetical protein